MTIHKETSYEIIPSRIMSLWVYCMLPQQVMGIQSLLPTTVRQYRFTKQVNIICEFDTYNCPSLQKGDENKNSVLS